MKSSKNASISPSPTISVTSIPGHQTPSPSPTIPATTIPSSRIPSSNPPIPATTSPSPRIPSPNPSISVKFSPSLLPSPDGAEFSELKRMKIDILYLEGNKEMLNYAKKIEKQLVSIYGLNKNKILVNEFSKKYSEEQSCEWSSVRYDPEEEDAARELKPLVEKIVPSLKWELLLVGGKTHRDRISLFLENKYTFGNLNPINQGNGRISCEIYKR